MNNERGSFNNIAFFPNGTVIEYKLWEKDQPKQLTVDWIIQNGLQSFVLCQKQADRDSLCPAVNIEHVTRIVKRGTGDVTVRDLNSGVFLNSYHTDIRQWNITKPASHYATANLSALVLRLVTPMIPTGAVVIMEDLVRDITPLGRLECSGYAKPFMISKKKLKRWLKANVNRYLMPMKERVKCDLELCSPIESDEDDYESVDPHFLKPVILKSDPAAKWYAWSVHDDRIISCLPYDKIPVDDDTFVGDLTTFKGEDIQNLDDFYPPNEPQEDADWSSVWADDMATGGIPEPEPVFVRFQLTEEIWNTVVAENTEAGMTVESEGSDTFVVCYDSQEAFNAALQRFGGMVEYAVIQADEV